MKKDVIILIFAMLLVLSSCGNSTTAQDVSSNQVEETVVEQEEYEPEPFEPLRFSGIGDKIISDVHLPWGIFIATISIDSTNHYDVSFHLNNDEYELLVNNYGVPYVGTVLVKGSSVAEVENGILEIHSDGEWEVVIERLSGVCSNNISGTGDVVTGVFDGTGNKEVITINVDSTNHYSVQLFEITEDENWNYYELLVNDYGKPYSGEVLGNLAEGKQYFFAINAVGDWTISFGDDPITYYGDNVVKEKEEEGYDDSEKNSESEVSFAIPKEALEASSVDTTNMTEDMQSWVTLMSSLLLSACDETHSTFDGETLYIVGILSALDDAGEDTFNGLKDSMAPITSTPNTAIPEAKHIIIALANDITNPTTFFIAQDGQVTDSVFGG